MSIKPNNIQIIIQHVHEETKENQRGSYHHYQSLGHQSFLHNH
jgi:hypothetical protein